MVWSLLAYFGLGLLLDVIVTAQMRAVVVGKDYLASFLSVGITLIAMLVIQNIVVSNSLLLIISYAFGTGFGTLIGMKLKHLKK